MVKRYLRFAAFASLAISLSLVAVGCSQKTVSTGGEVDSAPAEQTQATQPEETAVAPVGSEETLDSTASGKNGASFTILEGRSTGPMLPVYYDFDQSNVRPDQKGRIEQNAAYLKGNTGVKVTIEGNCDERGTSEYNMALGERRAISVKKYLMNLGVGGNRISTISYGEEKPLNYGHDELGWSQNRRADFVQK